jgi:hypothetical protein
MSAVKRFSYTPILGWSATRYDTFSICKRKYFYQYYAKYDPELPRRRIDSFKNLVSIPLEIGSVTHKVIEVLLNRLKRSDEEIDLSKFFDFTERTIERRLDTNKFDEVVYGQLEEVGLVELLPTVRGCLENLLDSERFGWLMEEAIATRSEWVIDPPGYGESRMDDLKVYCKVDFMFPIGERLHIVDWKTGKEDAEKHRKQLLGYSTWASFHFEVAADHVDPSIAYLQPEYREVHETFNTFDLENFAIQVRAETEEMYEYCRDVKNNIPRDKSEFAKVDMEAICSYCNFRALCFPRRYPAKI